MVLVRRMSSPTFVLLIYLYGFWKNWKKQQKKKQNKFVDFPCLIVFFFFAVRFVLIDSFVRRKKKRKENENENEK